MSSRWTGWFVKVVRNLLLFANNLRLTGVGLCLLPTSVDAVEVRSSTRECVLWVPGNCWRWDRRPSRDTRAALLRVGRPWEARGALIRCLSEHVHGVPWWSNWTSACGA